MKTACTDTNPHRCLIFDAGNAHIVCVVYGKNRASTLYRFSAEWKLESATSSLLRMKNLVVVRGTGETNMMIGPCDFFGSLENIKGRYYSCEIMPSSRCGPSASSEILAEGSISMRCGPSASSEIMPEALSKTIMGSPLSEISHDNVICFFRHDAVEPVYCAPDLPSVPRRLTVQLDGEWNSHTLPNSTHSIFAKPGILHFDTPNQTIILPSFDPRAFNLDKFRARLVRNDQPFMFVDVNSSPNTDDLRVISYRFGSSYVEWQSETNGLFLETHKFIQSITPLNESASGFVMLACECTTNSYQIIGVQIPIGHSLILDENCIHGDSTLVGYYAMCMTSNHVSMATADTVFLKNANDENILFVDDTQAKPTLHTIEHRNMIYNYPSLPMGAIFNPFARGYWKYLKS